MAGHHSIHSNATQVGEKSSSKSDPSHIKEDAAAEGEGAEADKHGTETVSDDHAASDGEEEQKHPQDTLTSVSQILGTHEDTNSESNPGEKVQSIQKK